MNATAKRAWIALAGCAACAAIACAAARLPRAASAPPPSSPPPEPPASAAFAGPSPPAPCSLGAVAGDGMTGLERALARAMRDARFDEVVDLSPGGEAACAGADAGCAPEPIAHRPSVDLAVIAFAPGCAPAFADVMISRDFPGVHVTRFEPATLQARGVRYRRWDQARWDARFDPAAPFSDADDIVLPRPGDPAVDFTVPYPASNFKLLVAVELLAAVDRGALELRALFEHAGKKRRLDEWLSDMITWSDDESTQAIVRELHAIGAMARIDERFARLGLGTLQIHDTSAKTGRGWHPGRIHMSAWDTARLLWLLDPDAPPPSWRAPGGAPVDHAGLLRAESKATLIAALGEQAFHDVLSTTALCGTPRTERGIPALLPERWIAEDGHLRVEGTALTADVRPCNAAAEVTFAHKTGLTLNFGSDAGIVRGITGRARRHYIVAFFSNLGHRYTDPDKAEGPRRPNPCEELGVCYASRIGAMGRAIDAAIEDAVEPRSGERGPIR